MVVRADTEVRRAADKPRRISLPRWSAWFLVLAGLCLVWALASPLIAPPDEGTHTIRAAAVARGQLGGPDYLTFYGYATRVRVPGTFRALAEAGVCFLKRPAVTPDCVQWPEHDPVTRTAITPMGRYPPLYYLIVSWPTRVFVSQASVRAMRIISALVCAALLAAAFASASSLGRWAIIGVACAIPPMVVYLAGSVNPSGLELASAVCLWASMIALARAPAITTATVVRAVVGFAVFANTRGLSIVMAAVAVVATLAVAERERLRAIAANRTCRTAAIVAGTTAAVALAWDVTRGRVPSTSVPYHFTFADGLGRTWSTFEQSIAWFGDFEVRDVAAIAIFAVLWAVLLFLAFRRGVARERVVLAGIVVVATVFPIFVSMAHPPPLYTTWQGRYGLPLWVGVPIVAATIAGSPRSGARRMPAFATTMTFAVALGYAHLSAFATAAHRYAVGSSGKVLYFVDPVWRGSFPPLLLLLAAALLAAGFAWQIARA